MTTVKKEEFDDYEIIRTLAEAALHNQKSIARATSGIEKSVRDLNAQVSILSNAIATRVQQAIAQDLQKMIEEASSEIANKCTDKLQKANTQAERAFDNYKQAANYAITKTVLISATVAVVCALAVSLLLK